VGEKGESDGDNSAGLLGDASGCSFDGGSEGNLNNDNRRPVSRGVFDDCSRRKSAARPSGKRDRSESAPLGSHFEKTSLITLSTGIYLGFAVLGEFEPVILLDWVGVDLTPKSTPYSK